MRKNLTDIDLYIGLQGAFSAKRFVKDEGLEGFPYTGFKDCNTVFALTSSKNDIANPIARPFTGARHTGGKYGLRYANVREDVFDVITWVEGDRQTNLDQFSDIETYRDPGNIKKVLMIDASSIVDGKDAHNDILDEDMAELIWVLIKQFTVK